MTKAAQLVHNFDGMTAPPGLGFPAVFERFTEKARQVVVLAQEEARTLKHGYIGTEHILLGLLRVEDGVACQVLAELGVTLEGARSQVAAIVGEGETAMHGQMPFAPKAKKLLELSLREALSLGHNYIGTEHILLGLARVNEGVAARILLDFDADADAVRDAVVAKLTAMHAIEQSRGRAGRRTWFGMRGARPQWEYRVETREEIDAAWLNELGAQGWMLAGVAGPTLIFQRRCDPPGELRVAG